MKPWVRAASSLSKSAVVPPFWTKHATPKARNMVRRVLQSSTHPVGMTSREIYEQIHERFPDEKVPAPPPFTVQPIMKGKYGSKPKPIPEPPHREHPIRSLKYLKKIVLEDLAREGEIVKVPMRRNEEIPAPAPSPRPTRQKKGLVVPSPDVFVWKCVNPRRMKAAESPSHPQPPAMLRTESEQANPSDHNSTDATVVQDT